MQKHIIKLIYNLYQKLKKITWLSPILVIAKEFFWERGYQRYIFWNRTKYKLQQLTVTLGYLEAVIDGLYQARINLERQVNEQQAQLNQEIQFARDELMFELRKQLKLKPDSPAITAVSNQSDVSGCSSVQSINKTASLILNEKKLQSLTEIHLNLGCGKKHLANKVNIDNRHLPGVDILAPVDQLPFEGEAIQSIYAAHLLEHFPHQYLQDVLLPYWHSLLKPGGELNLIVPDALAMMNSFHRGEMSFEDFALLTFGKQDYEGDFHYVMFSVESLTELLKATGFRDISVVEQARRNGLCFEMEVLAFK